MTPDGRFKVDFYGYIYDDCRDGIALEKTIRDILKPEIDFKCS